MNSIVLALSSVLNYGRKYDSTTRFGNDCHSSPDTRELYGDLDISVIDELPVKTIQTVHRFDSNFESMEIYTR
jgi:hypothetical protein